MTPEEIRATASYGVEEATKRHVIERTDLVAFWIAEIAAQLAELNEKFADFFASLDDVDVRGELTRKGEK